MQLSLSVLQAMVECPYKAWQLSQTNASPEISITTNSKIVEYAWMKYQQESIFNDTHKVSRITKQADKLLECTQELLNKKAAPPFYKVSHCTECQFKDDCLKKLKERDCISLLGGMTPKVMSKYHRKGITTITQLSYLFRPRRRRRGPQTSGHYSWELKALAIREQKAFILHPPDFPQSTASIYLDFEGLPDENVHYLLGGVIMEEGKENYTFSYWADTKEDEQKIFKQLVDILLQYHEAPIYHFGSYENKAFKVIAKKYPNIFKKLLPTIEKRMVNLLSFLRSHVYTPVFTNGLKELATYLGFSWTDTNASGLQSIHWRKQWESNGDATIKKRLLQYNTDDCNALHKVHEWLHLLGSNSVSENVQQVNAIRRHTPYKLQNNLEYGEDFQIKSKAAYFDYQRSKIYWRDKKSPIAKTKKQHVVKKKGLYVVRPKCTKTSFI